MAAGGNDDFVFEFQQGHSLEPVSSSCKLPAGFRCASESSCT